MPMQWGDERVPTVDVLSDIEDYVLEHLKQHKPRFLDLPLLLMKLDHLIVRLLNRKAHNED